MYDCNTEECQQCPPGSYQPQWGQTSCWPCPANTTTDNHGASSLIMCKSKYSKNMFNLAIIYDSGHTCPFYTKEGVGIMESPNYPGHFPVSIPDLTLYNINMLQHYIIYFESEELLCRRDTITLSNP